MSSNASWSRESKLEMHGKLRNKRCSRQQFKTLLIRTSGTRLPDNFTRIQMENISVRESTAENDGSATWKIVNQRNNGMWNLTFQLLELISAIGKRWSQIANKFTKPQSRLTLRKRFKFLIEEAYTKLGHDVSQREAVSFLLQQKYEKAQCYQNKWHSKKGKKTYSANKIKNSTSAVQKSSSENESSPEQDSEWVDSKCNKLKCQDFDHSKINVVMQSQMAVGMDQNWGEHSQLLFGNGVQLAGNMWNVGYIPMEYSHPIYPIMSFLGVESVSDKMNGNGYPVCGPIMFYL